MKVITTIKELREQVKEWKRDGYTVGLCPTMGYLHEGHASLFKNSSLVCDKTVASVFVNPVQFGPGEDLDSYPRDFDHDCRVMEENGVDLAFHPEVSEMFADDFTTFADINELSDTLCGKSRPVHFRGVLTIITKLLNIVTPDRIFFGQKDAQQLAIVRRMVRDFNFDVEVIGCPIVREDDGLAKSSRNKYLNPEERSAAIVLSRSIKAGQKLVKSGERDSEKLLSEMRVVLTSEPLADVEYVEVVDGENMQPIKTFKEGDLVAMAVRIGKTRLIDNFTVGENI